MKRTIYTLMIALGLPLAAAAQTTAPYDGHIGVSFPDYVADGDKITLLADIDLSALDLSSRQMVELTPVLRSTQTSYEERFAPVVVAGRRRANVIARAEHFGDYTWAVKPSEVVVLKRKTDRTRQVAVTVPFQKWMRHSELVLVETCTACGNRPQEYSAGVTSKIYACKNPYAFPAPYQPVYAVSYVEPEVEPVKVMSDTYSARLQFQSGRSNLVQSLGNNSAVLSEVDRVIGNLKLDSLLTLKRIVVKGYASPEGSSSSNYNLSVARAKAFVNYLNASHHYRAADRVVTSQGMGEDWDGLRKLVEQSGLEDSTAILSAIDSSQDNDRREAAVKRLSGGRTWRTLLADYFPDLRRNEYTIEYEVRGFNAEEAKSLVWSRPQLLSLNELFMVAGLYEPTSQEYKDIFHIAARMYPSSPVAQFNTAAMEVESGLYDSAIVRLKRIDTPQSWNNLGIAYWHKGEHDKALECFNRAAAAGLGAAKENVSQYNLWLEDKD